jgi:hypothetical protein
MARKTHWKALTRSQKKKRRWNRRYGLLFAIFGRKKSDGPPCCTPENPCNPRSDDDWIRNFRDDYPYLK